MKVMVWAFHPHSLTFEWDGRLSTESGSDAAPHLGVITDRDAVII